MLIRTWICTAVLLFAATCLWGKDEVPSKLIAGKQIAADATLSVGTRLVAVYEKKNYLVEVREVKSNKKVKIVWLETKEETDDVMPNELYQIGDSTPTRKSRTALLPEEYRAFDKNGDGQIGLYEWNRSKYAEFRKLDKNHDGFLTPQELTVKTGNAAPATPAAVPPTTPAETPKDK